MILTSKKFRFVIYSIILAAIILIINWGLWENYFESDEWSSMATFMSESPYRLSEIFRYSGGYHYSPLLKLVKIVIFLGYGFSMWAHALTSLSLHFIISVFLMIFTYKLTKKDYLSFLAALIFAITPVTILGHVWFSTYLGKMMTLLFVIPALYFAYEYCRKKAPYYLYISLVLSFLGFLTGEFAYVLIVWIPLLILIFRKNFPLKTLFRRLEVWLTILVYMGTIVARYIMQAYFVDPLQTFVHYQDVSHYFDFEKIAEYMVKFVSLGFHINFEEYTADTRNNFYLGLVGFSILFLSALLFYTRKRIPQNIKKTYLLSVLCLPICGILFSTAKFYFTRYFYYVPYIWYSLIIVIFFYVVAVYSSLIAKKEKSRRRIVVLLMTIFIIILSYYYIEKHTCIFNDYLNRTRTQREVIEGIANRASSPPDKVIFHLWGNRTYYNYCDLRVPFVRSVAHPIIVYFHYNQISNYSDFVSGYDNVFARHFYKKVTPDGKMTYVGTVQEYVEENDIGFGYVIYPSVLFELVAENQLGPDNVFSFFYDGKNNVLHDRTDSARKAIAAGLESTQLLGTADIKKIDTNRENDNIYRLFNRKKDPATADFWNSGSADPETSLNIELAQKHSVGRISMYLPLYSTLHSRYLGYDIQGSLNGQEWFEVFSASEYPANQNTGQLNFYFPAKEVKYLLITTTRKTEEERPFAITELEIYSIPN